MNYRIVRTIYPTGPIELLSKYVIGSLVLWDVRNKKGDLLLVPNRFRGRTAVGRTARERASVLAELCGVSSQLRGDIINKIFPGANRPPYMEVRLSLKLLETGEIVELYLGKAALRPNKIWLKIAAEMQNTVLLSPGPRVRLFIKRVPTARGDRIDVPIVRFV